MTAETIKAAAANLAEPGSRKAWIHDLWQVAAPLTMDLDAFKAWLLVEWKAGRINLSRWDLAGSELVDASEIRYMHATFHQAW